MVIDIYIARIFYSPIGQLANVYIVSGAFNNKMYEFCYNKKF